MLYKTQRLLSSLNQPVDSSSNPLLSHDVETFRGDKTPKKGQKSPFFLIFYSPQRHNVLPHWHLPWLLSVWTQHIQHTLKQRL